MWEPRRLTTVWAATAYYRDNLALRAKNLTVICELIFYKIWEPRRLTTIWASTACYKDRLARKANNITVICEPIV
jgi:hypothetical protein